MLDGDRYQVEFLPDPSEDPMDRDTVQVGDIGGIYAGGDLEPLT